MATFSSYDINGKKLSFANWISNLSPTDTFFTSATGKEAIQQVKFSWQTDVLAPAAANAQKEGEAANEGTLGKTTVIDNQTQILRKVVKVSDTANALANYGRGRELQYQMEKAGKEIKRDLEFTLLSDQASNAASVTDTSVARLTGGFQSLVATGDHAEYKVPVKVAIPAPASGAAGAIDETKLTEDQVFELTKNLYLCGAHADTIMFHPRFASFFSSLQEKGAGTGSRIRMFENTPKLSVYVSEIVDPLGQTFKLVPNRFMPDNAIYIFNPADWTQMVLRAPTRTQLAKDGSYEKWMIEMEVGLRHRNPYASAVLTFTKKA